MLLTSTLAGSAWAQANVPDNVLTPAPVPNREMGAGPPADRAGRDTGSDRAAPFSGLPATMGAGSGQSTPATVGTADKESAPAPSVSR